MFHDYKLIKFKKKNGKKIALSIQWENDYGYWCLQKHKNNKYYFISKNNGKVDLYDELGIMCLKESIGKVKKYSQLIKKPAYDE
jgi:hypothetical protein